MIICDRDYGKQKLNSLRDSAGFIPLFSNMISTFSIIISMNTGMIIVNLNLFQGYHYRNKNLLQSHYNKPFSLRVNMEKFSFGNSKFHMCSFD